MKMLLVAQAYLPRAGGGIRYAVDLITHLRSQGHSVDIVTVNTTNRLLVEEEGGGRVIRLPRQVAFDSAWLSAQFPMWLTTHASEYDLIHFNAPNPVAEVSHLVASTTARRMPRSICFFHAQAAPAKRFGRIYNQTILQAHLGRVERVIVSSPNLAGTTPVLQKHSPKLRVIPFGVGLPACTPHQATGLTAMGELNLLFVGRLVRYKGLRYLIEAMASAPGHLRIVGTGPLHGTLKQQVAKLGMDDRVEFLGYVSDIDLGRYYAQADVLILPSVDPGETFGYVLIEAMAHSTAAISTELGTGTSYANMHNETGFVVAPRDSQALAGAIRALDRDRSLLQQFKSSARGRVERLFSLPRMLSQMERLLSEVGFAV